MRLSPAIVTGSVQAILFPRYRAGAPTQCRSITKATALQRLMKQCLVVRGRLDVARVRAMVDWIETVTCCELESGSLSDAVDAAAGLLAATPTHHVITNTAIGAVTCKDTEPGHR